MPAYDAFTALVVIGDGKLPAMIDRDRLPSLDDRFWSGCLPYWRSCR